MWPFSDASLPYPYDRIKRQEPYRGAGADDFAQRQAEDTARRLVKRLEHLDHQMTLQH
jgi:hypothetical protein